MENNNNNRSGRGFAGMDPDKQREIASKGGKAAHEKGTAHEFDSQEAAEAGAKGGKASHSNDSNHNGSNRNQERDEDGRFMDDD
ncbi:MAG TPA: KGG domain-containing protein [Candidatus Paceibacterota bacterium]|nr:KGG domain-containing protein [Candidatus Paceibacterota bacterium]